jgi:tricarballylate dehydrogenase
VSDFDVIVVGAGNAALAAVSAREQGAVRVLALEKAPRALRGGNTHYSGGLLRIAFDRAEDLRALVPDAERDVPGFYAGVGGTGLISGAVFGRLARAQAAAE